MPRSIIKLGESQPDSYYSDGLLRSSRMTGRPPRLGRRSRLALSTVSHKKPVHLPSGMHGPEVNANYIAKAPTTSERARQICKDWYTTSAPLPSYYSCNWLSWDGLHFFLPRTLFEKMRSAQTATHIVDALEDDFLFVADGIYYDYNATQACVWRFDRETYANPLEFIWREATHEGPTEAIATAFHMSVEDAIKWTLARKRINISSDKNRYQRHFEEDLYRYLAICVFMQRNSFNWTVVRRTRLYYKEEIKIVVGRTHFTKPSPTRWECAGTTDDGGIIVWITSPTPSIRLIVSRTTHHQRRLVAKRHNKLPRGAAVGNRYNMQLHAPSRALSMFNIVGYAAASRVEILSPACLDGPHLDGHAAVGIVEQRVKHCIGVARHVLHLLGVDEGILGGVVVAFPTHVDDVARFAILCASLDVRLEDAKTLARKKGKSFPGGKDSG
ncbi:hypothetical protein C8R44DRAFT_753852 [Mycena epipterygia]|nr:hypothetical protein C8R44DRAFT_753852 [Mycena epipterygia]